LVRLSTRLPATGSDKVLKRELQAELWQTDEPVYRWTGRGRPGYRRMTVEDTRAFDAEFARHGWGRYI
jgi:fatty-acyl-CoA synthase